MPTPMDQIPWFKQLLCPTEHVINRLGYHLEHLGSPLDIDCRPYWSSFLPQLTRVALIGLAGAEHAASHRSLYDDEEKFLVAVANGEMGTCYALQGAEHFVQTALFAANIRPRCEAELTRICQAVARVVCEDLGHVWNLADRGSPTATS